MEDITDVLFQHVHEFNLQPFPALFFSFYLNDHLAPVYKCNHGNSNANLTPSKMPVDIFTPGVTVKLAWMVVVSSYNID